MFMFMFMFMFHPASPLRSALGNSIAPVLAHVTRSKLTIGHATREEQATASYHHMAGLVLHMISRQCFYLLFEPYVLSTVTQSLSFSTLIYSFSFSFLSLSYSFSFLINHLIKTHSLALSLHYGSYIR